jgi:hypothetical protein
MRTIKFLGILAILAFSACAASDPTADDADSLSAADAGTVDAGSTTLHALPADADTYDPYKPGCVQGCHIICNDAGCWCDYICLRNP